MMINSMELIRMIEDLLNGNYNTNDFSFDFPDRLHEVYDQFLVENKELCDYLEEEMPELCGWFDPHNTGDAGTLNEEEFKEKVSKVYQKALPMIKKAH